MERTERVELTVLCLVNSEDAYLLQDRGKEGENVYLQPDGRKTGRGDFGDKVSGIGVPSGFPGRR